MINAESCPSAPCFAGRISFCMNGRLKVTCKGPCSDELISPNCRTLMRIIRVVWSGPVSEALKSALGARG